MIKESEEHGIDREWIRTVPLTVVLQFKQQSSKLKSIDWIFFPESFEWKILSKSERRQKSYLSFVEMYRFIYTIKYDNLDRYYILDHLEFYLLF